MLGEAIIDMSKLENL